MEPKATEPIPGIQIQAPQVPPPAPQNLPTAPQQSSDYPVPVPLRPKPPKISELVYTGEAPDEGKIRRGLGKIVTVILILVALTVLATAAGAAYLYMSSGDEIVSDGLKNMDVAPKVHMAVRLEPESSNARYAGSFAELTTEIDRGTGQYPHAQTVVEVSATGMRAAAEVRYIHPIIYGKIVSVPDQYKTYGGDIVGKWYSISLDTIAEMAEGRGYKLGSTTPKKKTPSEVYEGLKARGVFDDSGFTGLKKTERGWVREYSILINKDALASYLSSYGQYAELNEQSRQKVEQSVRKRLDELSFKPIIVRTGLIDGNLHDVTFSVDSVGSSVVEGIKGLTMTFTNDETKTDFTVTKPEGAISLDEMIAEAKRTSEARGKVAMVQASLSNARAAAELYFDKSRSYLSMCTKDTQLKAMFTSIKDYGSTVTCRSTKTAYLMAARLPQVGTSTVSSFQCVDSTGNSKQLTKVPTGYVCK
jgi:hypothetical protein